MSGTAAENARTGFPAVAEDWLRWKRTELKASSMTRYTDIVNGLLLPYFGGKEVGAVTRSDAASFAQWLLSEGNSRGGGLSPRTAATVLSVLKSILHYAGQIRGLAVADLKGVAVKQPVKPLRVFSVGEQQRLCRYLLHRRDPCSIGIVLALYTGLRLGELCALRWEHISLEERCLTVRQTMQRLPVLGEEKKTAVVLSTPKSPSSLRTIPLPEGICELLESIRAPGDCYLLTGEPGYIEPRSLENRFKSALRNCGIEPSGFHICRHSFATRCVELGFDVKSLSEILGHSSVNMTMNRYVHPSMEFKRDNMNRLGALMEL